MSKKTPMNRIIHFEIPANKPEESMLFYQQVFGWKFQQFAGQEYWLAETGAANEAGINGAIIKRRDPAQPLSNSIQVPDMDKALKAIAAAGGQVVVPKTEMPGGSFAFFKDPDGNILGLWEMQA